MPAPSKGDGGHRYFVAVQRAHGRGLEVTTKHKGGRTRHFLGLFVWSVIPAVAFVTVAAYIGLAIDRHVYPPVVPVEGLSMRPLLHFGDLVMLKRANIGHLHTGDIIAFRTTTDVQQKWNVPGSYVHRIVSVQNGAYGQQFQTKGDNVPGKDPFWTVQQNVIGIYAGKISGAGYPILFFRSKQGKILLAAALLIMFLYWLLGVFERRRAADAVNVHNLSTIVDEARRITMRLEESVTSAPIPPPVTPLRESVNIPASVCPKDWLISGDFLTGALSEDSPHEVVQAQRIAAALESVLSSSAWPRYEIASRAGVPLSTVHAILNGDALPDFASLSRIGKLLGISFWAAS